MGAHLRRVFGIPTCFRVRGLRAHGKIGGVGVEWGLAVGCRSMTMEQKSDSGRKVPARPLDAPAFEHSSRKDIVPCRTP